jgi:hypothetical protein
MKRKLLTTKYRFYETREDTRYERLTPSTPRGKIHGVFVWPLPPSSISRTRETRRKLVLSSSMVKTNAQIARTVEAQKIMSKAKPPASKRDTADSTTARTGQGAGSAQKNYNSELLQAAHQEALEVFTSNYKEIQVCDGVLQ